jgi:hypothetical protein
MARHSGLSRVFPIFFMCALLGGCDRDVTSDPKYWGGYVPGATYRLVADVHYWDDGTCYPASWNTISNGAHGTMVPPGTRIRLDRIERYYSGVGGHFLRVVGRFLDGPFAGRDVHLPALSTRLHIYDEDKGFRPDPKYLEVCP